MWKAVAPSDLDKGGSSPGPTVSGPLWPCSSCGTQDTSDPCPSVLSPLPEWQGVLSCPIPQRGHCMAGVSSP